MKITTGDFDDPRIIELLNTHFTTMRSTGPAESCHVLPLAEMQVPELTFWAAWENGILLGVGALYELSADHGEIKSMHTVHSERRRGTAKSILDHIVGEARTRGYTRLSLETGAMDFFKPARAMYERNGFAHCAPFGSYVNDPNSVFMTREI